MKSHKEKNALKSARKLDSKSSRGVLFENEDMRLRTIEINAEVEKGQSDLRKLKKENETLKQQVWTLRDEYDKLESIVKEKGDSEDPKDIENDSRPEEDDSESDCPAAMNIECSDAEQQLSVGDSAGEGCSTGMKNESSENPRKVYSGQVRSLEYGISLDNENEVNASSSDVDYILRESLMSHSSNNYMPTLTTSSQSILAATDFSSYPDSEPGVVSSNSFLSQRDHFNLDQLLDFASSFHYDRRKHLSVDETDQAITLAGEERKTSLTDECFVNQAQRKAVSPSNSLYSTLRRRSSTIIEKMKTSNSSALLREIEMSMCGTDNIGPSSITPRVPDEATTVSYSRSSYYFAGSLDGRSQSLGAGLNSTTENANSAVNTSCPLYSSNSTSNIAGTTSSSLDSSLPLVSVYSPRTSMVRLSSIEPNTVMISVNDIPQLWDVSTQEIIDEIEQQAPSVLMDIKGVRVASRAAYLSVTRKENIQTLIQCGLTVRGYLVGLIDITRESSIVKLSGVPHYIADCTLSILLSAFGIIIGEIERRFYKGVDTGERYVRMKLKHHVKLPKYVTVGGCRIIVTINSPDGALILTKGSLGGPLPSAHPHSFSNQKSELHSLISNNPNPIYTNTENDMTNTISNVEVNSCQSRDAKDSFKKSKKYSSRCMVNLKIPEHPDSVNGYPLPVHRKVQTLFPGPGTSDVVCPNSSSLSDGRILRVGSLGRGTSSRAGKLLQDHLTPNTESKSSSLSTRSSSSMSEHAPRETSSLKSNTVAFKDLSGDNKVIKSPPPLPQVPSQVPGTHKLANGILRKTVGSAEQESLLPNQPHGATATIKNRFKIGRSVSYDGIKQKQQLEKEKKKKSVLRKMEIISENTHLDESSDITPLSTSRSISSRRDSEKSSECSDKTGRGHREVIDLPWCGCWGNGCF